MFGAKAGVENLCGLIASCHDLGKYSEQFKHRILTETKTIPVQPGYDGSEIVDHSTAGAQFINQVYPRGNSNDNMARQLVSLCIMSHHSGLIDVLSSDGEFPYMERIENDSLATGYCCIKDRVDSTHLEHISELLTDGRIASDIDSMISKVKDMVRDAGGAETGFGPMYCVSLYARFVLSCVIDADCTDTERFYLPQSFAQRNMNTFSGWDVYLVELESYLKTMGQRTPLDCERKRISDSCLSKSSLPTGAYVLNVPTGGGKTLSGLRFAMHHAKANGLKHIFFIVPFTAVIDQNIEAVRKALGHELANGVLAFHSNIPESERTNQDSAYLAENWDAPIIFTTMVQFLDTFYGSGSRKTRRMHNLAESIIVFDEVQAIPVNCIGLFNMAVNFLTQMCHSTAILSTATQPEFDKVPSCRLIIPDGHVLIDADSVDRNLFRRVQFIVDERPDGWAMMDVAGLIRNLVDSGRSVLIVMNSRKDVQSLHNLLKAVCGNRVFHLSTSMCPAHRCKVIEELKASLKNGERPICVSTQLIEAGVDIDFDAVVRAIAGIDSIVQSAGRCNRHGRSKSGEVRIINPKGSHLPTNMYEEINIAERVIGECGLEDEAVAIDTYYRYLYHNKGPEMKYRVGDTNGADMLGNN